MSCPPAACAVGPPHCLPGTRLVPRAAGRLPRLPRLLTYLIRKLLFARWLGKFRWPHHQNLETQSLTSIVDPRYEVPASSPFGDGLGLSVSLFWHFCSSLHCLSRREFHTRCMLRLSFGFNCPLQALARRYMGPGHRSKRRNRIWCKPRRTCDCTSYHSDSPPSLFKNLPPAASMSFWSAATHPNFKRQIRDSKWNSPKRRRRS